MGDDSNAERFLNRCLVHEISNGVAIRGNVTNAIPQQVTSFFSVFDWSLDTQIIHKPKEFFTANRCFSRGPFRVAFVFSVEILDLYALNVFTVHSIFDIFYGYVFYLVAD